MKMKRRYSGDDHHLGPFTYSRTKWKRLALVLDSGEAEYPGCTLQLDVGGHVLICELPPIIRPWRTWVDTPRGGYWDEHRKEYGISYSNGFLQVFLGQQTHDSTTTKSWSTFLPWTQWRFIRFSLYGLEGEHFWTEMESRHRLGSRSFDVQLAATEQCPKARFSFYDFDGEQIEATTHIEEREWLFGEGWFRWLSIFRAPMVRRSLSIQFSKETGPKKGSWKGGTLGHGIDLQSGELHESAFRRYCSEHKMTFARTLP